VSADTSSAELPERLQDEPISAIAVAPITREDPPRMLDLRGVLGDPSWVDVMTSIVHDLATSGSPSSLAAEGPPCTGGSCEEGSRGIDPGASLILAAVVVVIAAGVAVRTVVRRSGALSPRAEAGPMLGADPSVDELA
jgi:hypothetical protein